MSDFFSSILQFYKNRAKTQVYGLFAFWWFVFHSQYFVVLFFTDQALILEKTGLLKNEYLNQLYGSYLGYSSLDRFVAPFIMTWLFIWLLPRIVINPAYKKEKDNDYNRQIIKVAHDKKVESLTLKSEQQDVTNLQARQTVRKQRKKIEEQTPEVLWDKQYGDFMVSGMVGYFGQLIDCLYVYGGEVAYEGTGYPDNPEFQLNKNILAYADTNDLIIYDRAAGKISLTDKGKYFVKNFQAGKIS